MKFSLEKIEHFARLARIELKEEEKKKFAQDISSILLYVEQLQKLDTKKIEPIAQITGLKNVLREDKVEESREEVKENLFKNIPERKDKFIKVKKVLEN